MLPLCRIMDVVLNEQDEFNKERCIAQLVERDSPKVEVRGSSPLTPVNNKTTLYKLLSVMKKWLSG